MPTTDERIVELLTELRDGQREQLARYVDVTERSLTAQQTSIQLQRRIGRLYRIVVMVAALIVAGTLAYFFHLLT
jgi:hypothetical protein